MNLLTIHLHYCHQGVRIMMESTNEELRLSCALLANELTSQPKQAQTRHESTRLSLRHCHLLHSHNQQVNG